MKGVYWWTRQISKVKNLDAERRKSMLRDIAHDVGFELDEDDVDN